MKKSIITIAVLIGLIATGIVLSSNLPAKNSDDKSLDTVALETEANELTKAENPTPVEPANMELTDEHMATIEKMITLNQDIKPFSYPKDIYFANERVPIEDFEVRERLDREMLVNCFWHSNTMMYMMRSTQWFPVIEPILAEEGVPDDFKYLCVAESGLKQALSSAGASGMWQFMKATGTSYGLEIRSHVDERYHVEKSTRAACKYLKAAKNRFGSWSLAAAAYNAGEGGISNQLKRQQADNYYDLLLNQETARYVLRCVAIKEIMSNPQTYGFNLAQSDFYPMQFHSEETVTTSINDLSQWAKDRGTNYKKLKYANPWLRDKELGNSSGKTYVIKLPY